MSGKKSEPPTRFADVILEGTFHLFFWVAEWHVPLITRENRVGKMELGQLDRMPGQESVCGRLIKLI